jgi:hypothetical protein
MMTREELLDALEAMRRDVLNAVVHNADYALYSWAVDVIYAAEDYVLRPKLRKWTADDGTPPDGWYLTKIGPDGKVVNLLPDPLGDPCVYFIADGGREAIYPTQELWDQFTALYGPIEADGEAG